MRYLKGLVKKMGDIGEYWKDVKDIQKEKRWSNYEQNKQLLEVNGIPFTEKANAHFLIFDSEQKVIFDFWATTGLFISRKTQKRSRGIKNLIKHFKMGNGN